MVVAEKELAADRRQQFDIRINGLEKQHNGTAFKAVDDLHLAIPHGECFGLLGVNGAGKTTTISILCGMYPSTGGRAEIAGLDVDRDMDKIRTIIGICPQFDKLFDNLTVKEH